jgi:hypothetical protein
MSQETAAGLDAYPLHSPSATICIARPGELTQFVLGQVQGRRRSCTYSAAREFQSTTASGSPCASALGREPAQKLLAARQQSSRFQDAGHGGHRPDRARAPRPAPNGSTTAPRYCTLGEMRRKLRGGVASDRRNDGHHSEFLQTGSHRGDQTNCGYFSTEASRPICHRIRSLCGAESRKLLGDRSTFRI